MLDYINEDAFLNFAQYKFVIHRGYQFDSACMKQNSIIFCHTGYLKGLFPELVRSKFKHILITHGSDFDVTESMFSKKPGQIVKWFAENANFNHPDLIPIPIGLSPEYRTDLIKKNLFLSDNIEKLKNNNKDTNILYCNWDVGNNYEVRSNIISKIKMTSICQSNLPYQEYYINMSHFKYVVSPPGHGRDCHRTWESLYMGCTPIVKKHFMYDTFFGLPILQVNDYEEVTPELLANFSKQEFNYEKLYMTYWKNLITKEFNKL